MRVNYFEALTEVKKESLNRALNHFQRRKADTDFYFYEILENRKAIKLFDSSHDFVCSHLAKKILTMCSIIMEISLTLLSPESF